MAASDDVSGGNRAGASGGAAERLSWPPVDAAAMRAWQAQIGDDGTIAEHLGLGRATVANWRRRLGIAALPRAEDRRVREKRPRARLSGRAMARLYSGRRYEDLRLRDRVVARRAAAARMR